eukprot:s658_g5.t1
MKLQEWNNFLGVAHGMSRHQSNLQETYKYAKILSLDWQLGFVVWDVRLRRHKLITVPLPVPLSAVDRNTAECLVGVIDQVHALVPELDGFFSDFGFHVRMPVIDRFAANFKAERFIRTRDPGVISAMFTCDVHKASGCVKNALSLNDDSLSGIINLGLSLEGSGSLDRMRGILQEIFADELQVVYQQPPGEGTEVFKHRQAVLSTFLPLKTPKSRKRCFVLHCLANSDISNHEIIHYCHFGCCSSPEVSLRNFQNWVVWALLPSKLSVFNRKSWTGSDTAVHWCGLLHAHWQLLPRIFLRFLTPDRPLKSCVDTDDTDKRGDDPPNFLDDPAEICKSGDSGASGVAAQCPQPELASAEAQQQEEDQDLCQDESGGAPAVETGEAAGGPFCSGHYAALKRYHDGFLYQLFRILEGKQAAQEVYAIPVCMRDELSSKFFELYPTDEAGTSEPALAVLQSLATMVEVES